MRQLGHIFDIQRMSVYDGPGIRTAVFLKGCPLHCLWCHNPEGIFTDSEIFYNNSLCVLCGACVNVCENGAIAVVPGITRNFRRDHCRRCGRCVEVCPTGALEKTGRRVSVEDVIEEVLRDKVFYDTSGGGMTLSGGEPLMQYAFSLALLQSAKEHELHTCMETCGHGSKDHLLALATFTDVVLFDWKESDPIRHKEWTGVDNTRIRENLQALDKRGTSIILRCPIIPTLNQRPDHIAGIAALANELVHCHEVHLMTYHAYGQSKYERLGKEVPQRLVGLPPITQQEMEKTHQLLASEWNGAIRIY